MPITVIDLNSLLSLLTIIAILFGAFQWVITKAMITPAIDKSIGEWMKAADKKYVHADTHTLITQRFNERLEEHFKKDEQWMGSLDEGLEQIFTRQGTSREHNRLDD